MGTVNGGGGVDKFRIEIWKKAAASTSEALVYGNAGGASGDMDTANPRTLGGGSVTIHNK